MSTDRVTPDPEPSDRTAEHVDTELEPGGDPTTGRRPGGRTYDDETTAAELEATGVDVRPDEADGPGVTGLSGLDTIDPGRHHV